MEVATGRRAPRPRQGHRRRARARRSFKLVNAILKQAIPERCSDIHLRNSTSSVSLRFRIDGVLYERTAPPKQTFNADHLAHQDHVEARHRRAAPAAGRHVFHQASRTESSTCASRSARRVFGEKVVMRILDKGAVELDIDKIGFEPRAEGRLPEAARMPHGLIFLTGPTGSGKTTTLVLRAQHDQDPRA